MLLNLLYTNKYPTCFLVEEEAYAQVSKIIIHLSLYTLAESLRVLVCVYTFEIIVQSAILPSRFSLFFCLGEVNTALEH